MYYIFYFVLHSVQYNLHRYIIKLCLKFKNQCLKYKNLLCIKIVIIIMNSNVYTTKNIVNYFLKMYIK